MRLHAGHGHGASGSMAGICARPRWRGLGGAALLLATSLVIAGCANDAPPKTTATRSAADTFDDGPDAEVSVGDGANGAGDTAAGGSESDALSGADVATRGSPQPSPFSVEPNDTQASAVQLSYGGGGEGTVGGADKADWFVVPTFHQGKLRVWVKPATVTATTTVSGDKHYIELTASEVTPYTLIVDFRPEPVAITDHDPFEVGKEAEIRGVGLGTSPDKVAAYIGGVRLVVVSTAPAKMRVVVPYGAADGDLRVVSGGRGSATLAVKVKAPAYPKQGYVDGPEKTGGPDKKTTFQAGVVSVRAQSTVSADKLLAAVKPLGLTSAGWTPWRNRHRLAGAPTTLPELRALAEKLTALPEVVSAAPVVAGGTGPAVWPTSPFYAPDEPKRYGSVQHTGLHDAWKLFETLGGDVVAKVRVISFDSGLFHKGTTSCAWPYDPYPYRDQHGGFDLNYYNGSVWQRPTRANWLDRGDSTPTVCEDPPQGYSGPPLDGHGTACAGIIGAVAPPTADGKRANGVLTGFSRAGVDNGLPFIIDMWSTKKPFPQRYSLSVDEMSDAIALAEASSAKVAHMNWGWTDEDANFTGTNPTPYKYDSARIGPLLHFGGARGARPSPASWAPPPRAGYALPPRLRFPSSLELAVFRSVPLHRPIRRQSPRLGGLGSQRQPPR